MKTPLGNHAVQSAASIRAGLNRFSEWKHFQLGGSEAEPGLMASFVPELASDRTWTEKTMDLLGQPIHDALWSARLFDLSDPKMGRLGMYLATPYLDRPGTTAEEWEELLEDLKEAVLTPVPVERMELAQVEHTGGLLALSKAAEDLSQGLVDVALVAGVDSLLHSEFLTHLAEAGRLKLASTPSGLIPAEAGAAVVIERAKDAHRRKAQSLARVGAVAIEQEPIPLGPDHSIEANGLSSAVTRALGDMPNEVRHVFTDLTGERWRFLEWGIVETRCLDHLQPPWRLHHPADCLGDVGAPCALVAVGLYIQGLLRGYLKGAALITTSSARGERGAARIHPGEQVAREG
jgi:3-oxoacyl-[acyl-carrier-protein] synthase-1